MCSGGVALDGDCREGGTFTFSPIKLKLAFSEISYCSGSQSVVRVPLVVRELSLVVRRGNSELNINQAACPPKRFFFNCFKWEHLFHAEHSGVFFLAPRI